MTDNKLKDNEIIKALECCSNLECGECNKDWSYIDQLGCMCHVMRLALDLINRQKVKLIKEQNKNSKLRNERNRLQAKVDMLEKENKEIFDSYTQAVWLRDKKVNEAYKECIEKVKDKSCKLNMCHNDIVVKTDYQISGESLNNLLKELVGE